MNLNKHIFPYTAFIRVFVKKRRRIPIFKADISWGFALHHFFFLFLATLYSVILILHPYLRARRPGSSLGLLRIYEPHLFGPFVLKYFCQAY